MLMKILSAEQIRKWDEYTIAKEPVSSIQLMERAAAKCTGWIEEKIAGNNILIFCGKGNNGGDGLAIARQLAEKEIISKVFILESGSDGTGDFQKNLKRLHPYPVNIRSISETADFPAI